MMFHVFLDPSLYIACFPRKGVSDTTLDDKWSGPRVDGDVLVKRKIHTICPILSVANQFTV
jgi:hypothetical protein